MAATVTPCEWNEKVAVARVSGRMDMDETNKTSPDVMSAFEESEAGMIVDLGGVSFLSSSGLRMLLELMKRARRCEKKLAITQASPSIYKIFKVAQLDSQFAFFETVEEAAKTVWQ